MSPLPSRRRFIGIAASAAGLSLLPLGRRARAEGHLVTWRGSAMGAAAFLQIHHRDRAAAERLIERSLAEVRRLDAIFSLYRDDSALSVLNRQGMLAAPPVELVAVLEECRRYGERTGGAFDPTVQALWILYRDHFSRPGADPRGPSDDAVRAALSRVGFEHVLFDRNRIAFARRGMGLTLNGIAQGYVTDRVVAILRESGIASSLVDMGESRALGARPDGSPWRIGIADPDGPERIDGIVEAVDRAVATSGAYGFRFDAAGRFNHLLDPRTGASAHRHRSVTAIMPTATAADALSTAFSLLPEERIAAVLRALGTGEVRLIDGKGERRVVTA
ncbi:FAD:protein FMN transferase [Microvirga thermotolerans]|uniref:FAD:protein FMN transferase n=1 Tax=Microvirga thermotolerans TaxID=2651334 RepID=A0A5P9JQ94_9HYPH|nr:FAD:protein FMN transferase [Microvirga thermotolerans]QFU14807.1 FAD:protein FMN transferase [Microvirga thermotolerans]